MSAPGADDHFDDDFLLEVVHGLRPADEVEQAVAHARTCPPCDARLREAAADRERFRARLDRTLAAAASGARRRPTRARLGIALIAAAAVIAAIVTGVVLRRAPDSPASRGLLTLPAPLEIIHLRSREEPADLPRLEQAIALYGRRDWRGAARRLETPFADTRFEALRRIYLASALLEQGRTKDARAQLDQLGRTALPDPYADWRDWARLRTSPESTDAGRADSVVRALAGRPGPLQGEAQTLLERDAGIPPQAPQ